MFPLTIIVNTVVPFLCFPKQYPAFVTFFSVSRFNKMTLTNTRNHFTTCNCQIRKEQFICFSRTWLHYHFPWKTMSGFSVCMSYRYIFKVKWLKTSRRVNKIQKTKYPPFKWNSFYCMVTKRMETANLAVIPIYMYFLYESDKRTPCWDSIQHYTTFWASVAAILFVIFAILNRRPRCWI